MSYDIAQLSKDLGLGDIAEQLKGLTASQKAEEARKFAAEQEAKELKRMEDLVAKATGEDRKNLAEALELVKNLDEKSRLLLKKAADLSLIQEV